MRRREETKHCNVTNDDRIKVAFQALKYIGSLDLALEAEFSRCYSI